jgi:plastocyanin
MRAIRRFRLSPLGAALLFCSGCHPSGTSAPTATAAQPAPKYFTFNQADAGSVRGKIRFTGKVPARKPIDMSSEPACVEAHKGKAYDESLIVGSGGALANAFVYIEKGLEGKLFPVPTTPVVIDQRGCWFRPHILGIQTGQALQVVNSDPLTHNIHPMAQINREWNHSQGPGDEPINRKFLKLEVMVPVKCNIHSWMHASIGVLDHPYFAVSKEDGAFSIDNLPPGTYTLAVWQEKLGTQRQQVTVTPGQVSVAGFTFKAQ